MAAPAMKIAMVGTRGVPARYGGFETAIEEVGSRLVTRGHEVTVYCRRVDGTEALDEHMGMKLVHLPALRTKTLETITHSALSAMHAAVQRSTHDAVFVFNAANSPYIPFFRARRMPVAVHVDGLEWRRAKWGGGGRRYYRTAELLAVPLGRRAHRRRRRHRRVLPRRVRRVDREHRLRRADPARPRHRQARPARPHARPVPPRRRPVRTGEPRRPDRARRPGQQRRTARRGGRRVALRRRARPRHPRGRRQRPAHPADRIGLGPGPAEPALRALRELPPRPFDRRHQPVAAACHGRSRTRDRTRRALQPRGARTRRHVLLGRDVARRRARHDREPPRSQSSTRHLPAAAGRRVLSMGRRRHEVRAAGRTPRRRRVAARREQRQASQCRPVGLRRGAEADRRQRQRRFAARGRDRRYDRRR